MTLTDFLLARVAEEKKVAKAATFAPWSTDDPQWDDVALTDGSGYALAWSKCGCETLVASDDARHIVRHDPARVLAECEAKISLINRLVALAARGPDDQFGPGDEALLIALGTLAAVYADHPDYRDEWKP